MPQVPDQPDPHDPPEDGGAPTNGDGDGSERRSYQASNAVETAASLVRSSEAIPSYDGFGVGGDSLYVEHVARTAVAGTGVDSGGTAAFTRELHTHRDLSVSASGSPPAERSRKKVSGWLGRRLHLAELKARFRGDGGPASS